MMSRRAGVTWEHGGWSEQGMWSTFHHTTRKAAFKESKAQQARERAKNRERRKGRKPLRPFPTPVAMEEFEVFMVVRVRAE